MSDPASLVERSGNGRLQETPRMAKVARARHEYPSCRTEHEFARFLRYGLSSTSELEYHLIAARDCGVISPSDFVSLLTQLKEVRMMLFGLLKKLAVRNQGTAVVRESVPLQ
ncbi:MAG: four helix bundle protein [Gemmatimonadaceae bacterium]